VDETPGYVCGRCGGPNPVQASNCQWCGATLQPREGPPLTSSLPLLYTSPAPHYKDDVSAEAKSQDDESSVSSWGWWRAIVALAFVIIIISVALSQNSQMTSDNNVPIPSGPAYPVNVTIVDLKSSDNACGLDGTTRPGFLGVTNAFSGQTWRITGPPGGCTINAVNAITSGFMIIPNFYGPQTIPANQTDPIQISYDMQGLGGPYTGPLVLSVT
jgi:hypothetical protein